MSIRNMKSQTQLTCKIISTLLWLGIIIMCYIPSWGGFSNGYDFTSPYFHYYTGNMFTVSTSVGSIHYMLCWAIVACSIISVITVWTGVKAAMFFTSLFQAITITLNYWIVDSNFCSQIYELGLIQFILTWVTFSFAALLFSQKSN